jgi:sigma-B regulation protein RsbU (phosphoserine phosphatase)
MNYFRVKSLEDQLLDRRETLQKALAQVDRGDDLARLLVQVDQALERLGTDAYGRCTVCDGYMTDEEMQENPLRQYCLCDLSEHGRAALEHDLDMAWEVQASLLPKQNLTHAGWLTHYRYRPAGPVSGDYCDAIAHSTSDDWLYFLVGDVSGKGVAAAYLMAHLSALVRRTLDQPVAVDTLVSTVNRHLNERSSATHFVTLVAGRAHRSGRVEISNAGHCRPLVLRGDSPQELDSTGLPLGISAQADYQVHCTELAPGDSIVLYTDGISESRNAGDQLYGTADLSRVAATHRHESPTRLADACLADLHRFRGDTPPADDLTLMVVRYQ